jgi:hypothetical protein
MRDVFRWHMDVPSKNARRGCGPGARSAEGALQGVLDQPSAVVKRFFWLLFFAQAKKSDSPQGESLCSQSLL